MLEKGDLSQGENLVAAKFNRKEKFRPFKQRIEVNDTEDKKKK
jgi:hypothetical protein